MISDNYVTGDNIYLRELQNFFFEVLGMMSITHYGAIGDGRRDNYGPLQVAIDDAHRRGCSFLYVPYGRFIYTGELVNYLDPDTGKPTIIFMGNPHSHIVNIRTGEEIPIYQFGWLGYWYYNKEEIDEMFQNNDQVRTLSEDLILTSGTPLDMPTGIYFTGEKSIYWHTATLGNTLFGNNLVVYWDNDTKTFADEVKITFYDTSDWYSQDSFYITPTVIDDRTKIPTSKAVYDAIQNAPDLTRDIYMMGPDDYQDITQYTKLACVSINSTGTKLTYNDNAIVVGSGVSKVKVTGHIVGIMSQGETSCGFSVLKNTTSICGSGEVYSADPTNSQSKFETSIPDYIFDVEENDVISLWGQPTHVSGEMRIYPSNTWLTVEVIG